MTVSQAERLLREVGLDAAEPVQWGTAVLARAPGVYVIETPEPLARALIDLAIIRQWIERVPKITLDGAATSSDRLAERLADFWIAGQTVVYVGLAGTSLRSRVRGFYRTPLGDPRPHAGGHWLKTLAVLDTLSVWWAETSQPDRYEAELLEAFAAEARPVARGLAAELVLPFANRENADGVRKPHGIAGSTLPPTKRAGRVASPEMVGVARPDRTSTNGRVDRLARINSALQATACVSPGRQVTAVEAARELDRLGLLKDNATRHGLPLRNLLRDGKIEHAYQDAGRWWFIRCARPDQIECPVEAPSLEHRSVRH